MGSGNEIIETQTYYTDPASDWEFDDTQLITYDNPVFTEQCKKRNIKIDKTGFTKQFKLDELEDDDINEDDDIDDDNDFDDTIEDINENELDIEHSETTLSFKIGGNKHEVLSDNSDNDTTNLIQSKSDESESIIKSSNINVESTRDKVNNALNEIESSNESPKIKLNIDKTSSKSTTKIKLNI